MKLAPTNKDIYNLEKLEMSPTRDGFGRGLVEAGEKNKNVWVLTADVSESARVHWFVQKFPKRFVQVGISEQNMAGVAAGIATTGKISVLSAYGVFSPGRNWDQIRVSVCYSNLPVIIHGSHTGLNVGEDGATHQALEDIAITRVLPNLIVEAPADFLQAKKAINLLIERNAPAYIRTSRMKSAVFTTDKTPYEIGKANVYRDGSDITIMAHGVPVYESILAAKELGDRHNLSVAVVDMHSLKPIDKKIIIKAASKTKAIITVEEHQIIGGLGSAVAEVIAEKNLNIPLKRHGVYDRFCESGTGKELLHKYKLDKDGIVETILKFWKELKKYKN